MHKHSSCLSPQVSARRNGEKKKISQSFPRRSLTTWFTSSCVLYKMMSEAPSLISIHLHADCDPPQGLERLVSTSPAFFLQLTPTIKSNHQHLLGRSLSTHLGFHPLQLPFKGQAGPLNHVTLISSGACIHESCKTIAEREMAQEHSPQLYIQV